ncbi:MAG TPA: SPOR domain-containing protein [Ignavibacteriaceae bacterium]|nr:SPOR domain-containing protein [Ignavibacteriaceae bacterium]
MTILTKINPKIIWFLAAAVVFLFGCASSEKISEDENKTSDETYIFDEVPDSEVLKFETPVESEDIIYEVQIGAFSTKEKAEVFGDRSRNTLNKEVYVSFDSRVNLYIVRLSQEFISRTDAEKIRNELWTHEDYDDAWIVNVKSK